MRDPSPRPRRGVLLLCLALLAAGCARPTPRSAVAFRWLAGHAQPAFDPDGPPDALRVAVERLLSRGLVERDSSGRIGFVAAESASVSADGRTWSIRLREGLRFTDGSPATSTDFRDALTAGLARSDHATLAWLLGAISGVDRVRAGHALPPLGVEMPDPRTLVLRLARPDSLLLEKLASPGVGVPWKRRDAESWERAIGIGPYRVVAAQAGRSLTVLRSQGALPLEAMADTVRVRFVPGASRVRTLMRHAVADVVWPLPPGLAGASLPDGYALERREASPPRRLLLVLRADVPPTTRLEARHALAHGLHRGELLAALGDKARIDDGWLADGPRYDFPRLDRAEQQAWLVRGRLGTSFHVVLAFDADGAGADVAPTLQGDWAAQGLYAELRPLQGAAFMAEALAASAAQVQLVEAQPPLPGAAADLATLVMPQRGPAVGACRTGWRTREFDPWIADGPPAEPLDVARAQQRLEQERIVIPIARLPWAWAERYGAPGSMRWTPDAGPDFAAR